MAQYDFTSMEPHRRAYNIHEGQACQDKDTHLAAEPLSDGPAGDGTQGLSEERQGSHERREPGGELADPFFVALAKSSAEALHALDTAEVADIVAEVEGTAAHITVDGRGSWTQPTDFCRYDRIPWETIVFIKALDLQRDEHESAVELAHAVCG